MENGDGSANNPPDAGASGHYDVVIVGGGISGLTAAWSLRDQRVCLLESADIVGGRLKTEIRNPYWLNLGAHVLMAGGPMATLAAEVGVPLIEPPGTFLAVAKDGRVVRAGRSASMLFRLPLSFAARLSLARVGFRLMQARRTPPEALEAMTFAAFLGPMHPEVEALMRVVANRLTGELDEISAYVGVNGFHHLWLSSRLNIAGGSAALPLALQVALGDRIRTRARVDRVRQSAGHVEVDYVRHGRSHRLSADACVVAVPAPLAVDLIDDLPSSHVEALRRMRYTPFVVAGLFTKESSPMPWDDIYAMAIPDKSFCMFFNPANALRRGGDRTPGGSLVVYAVADRAAELLPRTDDVIESKFLDDVYAIFPEARDVIDEVLIQRWPHGTATGYPGRSASLAMLTGGWNRVVFAGDYMMPIDGTDASESGFRAAAVVRARLTPSGRPAEA